MTDSFITFRIDEDLKKRFEQIAKENDLTTSQILRACIRGQIENHQRENKKPNSIKGKR